MQTEKHSPLRQSINSISSLQEFRNDNNQSFYFEDQLTRTLPELYRTIYSRGNATKLVDYASKVMPYAAGGYTTGQYYTMKPNGVANWTFPEKGEDITSVDVVMDRKKYSVYPFTVGLTWTRQNILEAAGNVFSVIEEKRNAALQVMAQTSNMFAFFGRIPHDKTKQCHPDVYGLTNNPNFAVADVAGVDANAKKWVNKTAAQIIDDLFTAITRLLTSTNDNFKVNTIALPIAQYCLLTQKMTGVNNEFINDLFSRKYGNEIQFIAANELAGAGAGNTDIFIAYERNKEYMWFEHSEMRMTNVIETSPDNYRMNMEAYSGGVIAPRAASVLIYKGI